MFQNKSQYTITVSFQSIEIAKNVFPAFDNLFHKSISWGNCKNIKKKSQWLFEKFYIIRFEMHMDSPEKSENIFGI